MYVFNPPEQAAVPVAGTDSLFPVHRIYGIAMNFVKPGEVPDRTGRKGAFYFTKPADTVVPIAAGQTAELPYPPCTEFVLHEVEIACCIGTGGVNIPVSEALGHVFGYAVAIDLARRDLQMAAKAKGGPWDTGKGFDGACPITAITPAGKCPDMQEADLWLDIDGRSVQRGNTREMIRTIADQIHELSMLWELRPGDIILTGTPAGSGAVSRGEILTAGTPALASLAFRYI